MSLQFMVRVSSDGYGRPLTEKDWEPLAKRIARTAKGRSNARKSTVFVDAPYHAVECNEQGKITVTKGGFDFIE